MHIRLPKTVNELYTMVDNCACPEEGRRLPREEASIEVDSHDDDTTTPKKKGRRRQRKRKGKSVMAIEGSDNSSPAKKTKAESTSKEAVACADCQVVAVGKKLASLTGRTVRFIVPRVTTFKSAVKLNS